MNAGAGSTRLRPKRGVSAVIVASGFVPSMLAGLTVLTPSAAMASTHEASAAPVSAAPLVGGGRLAEGGLVFNGGSVAPPATSAASYVVADADSGHVLAALDPHGRYRPASTLKTLLALTMLPRLDRNGSYTAEQEDAAVAGARVGLVPGQQYKIRDLWYGLMLRSGNDAANALAKAGAHGDRARAVRMMNAEAQRLQALDTTAVNPSGLDEDGQFSSAYDLTLFARAGLARRDFSTYVGTTRREFPGNQMSSANAQSSKPFQMYTSNRLLLSGYPGAIGVKTGYTTLAKNTLIAAAERDGRKIIVTLMGEPAGRIYDDARALLDWGIANADKARPVGELVEPTTLSLVTAEDDVFYRADIPAAEKYGPVPVSPAAEEASRSDRLAIAVYVTIVLALAGASRAGTRRRTRVKSDPVTAAHQGFPPAPTIRSRAEGSELG